MSYVRSPGEVPGREHGILLPFWLTNSCNLVNVAMWEAALDQAWIGCLSRGHLPSPQLSLYLRDLFFSRIYQTRRDFDQVWEALATLFEISYRPATLGRPEIGRQLMFGPQRRLVLCESDGETMLCTNQSSAIEWETIVAGRFPHQPITWQMKLADFLAFLRIIERALTGEGRTLQARLNMDVLGDGFLIRVRHVFHLKFSSALAPVIRGLGTDGERLLASDRKKVSSYQKLWFGDEPTLRQMMSWQQVRVQGL